LSPCYIFAGALALAMHCHLPFGIFTQVSTQRSWESTAVQIREVVRQERSDGVWIAHLSRCDPLLLRVGDEVLIWTATGPSHLTQVAPTSGTEIQLTTVRCDLGSFVNREMA